MKRNYAKIIFLESLNENKSVIRILIRKKNFELVVLYIYPLTGTQIRQPKRDHTSEGFHNLFPIAGIPVSLKVT